MEYSHQPVLLREVLEYLAPRPGCLYIDCTLGGGGHTQAILEAAPDIRVIGIDRDLDAISHTGKKLEKYGERFQAIHGDFINLKQLLLKNRILERPDGLLYDLGVSSWQLDNPERGFSYQQDAPLDMRMDRTQKLTAYEMVNSWPEDELARIIKEYGEERWAKRIASFIVKERIKNPINTTLNLVEIIKKAIPRKARERGPHPAKRTFQALRIAVNNELDGLKKALEEGVGLLKSGGRVAVITFHSLEDRIVKRTFNYLEKDCICPPDFPECVCDKEQMVKVVTRKPITASLEELEVNHRARSAKLRVAERV